MYAIAMLVLTGVACAQNTAALVERLHRAVDLSSIDEPQLRPWHLKLSFRLFDAKGKPTEQGAIEEWWAGSSLYKTVYTSPSYSSTEIQTKDGLYRTKGSLSAPSLLELVLKQVSHPMPNEQDIEESKPDLRTETLGKIPMDCIMLAQEIKTVAYPPLGLFPTYCFDRDKDSLRVSYDFGSQLTARNRIGVFQGRSVVIDQMTNLDSTTAITAHVETLESMPLNEGMFAPSADLEKVNPNPVRVASGVVPGLRLTNVAPVYPAKSKANHTTGSVILRARIGRDGRIHSLKIISTPDADLAIASLAAVRQWTYKPYLVNGEPSEVDTQITVNFNISPY
jgi:TonB family protein